MPLEDIQAGLGHRDARTIRRYISKRDDPDRSPNYAVAAAFAKDG